MALHIPDHTRNAVLSEALADPYAVARNPPHGYIVEEHDAPYLKDINDEARAKQSEDIASFLRALNVIGGLHALVIDVKAGKLRVIRKPNTPGGLQP